MPVQGYGDDYGNRYAEVYSVEVIQLPATASLSLTEGVTDPTTFETLSATATASPELNEFVRAFESGEISTVAIVRGSDSKIQTESGSILATSNLNAVEFVSASESGAIQATGQPAFDEFVRAFESGEIQSTGIPAIDEFVRAFESGAVVSTPGFDIKTITKVFESGGINATAQYRFTPLVFTDSDDPVDAFRTVLRNIREQDYNAPKPDIYAMWEVDPQQRLKNPDPTVYVWSPTPGSLDRFSADGDLTTDERTVELMVMTYDSALTHRYTESLIDIISNYVDDNANLTVYEDVDVDTVADERGDHIFGESDHYINTIEISTARLRPTNSR